MEDMRGDDKSGCMCMRYVSHSVIFPNGCQTELCEDRASPFHGKKMTFQLIFFLQKALIQNSTYENLNKVHSNFSSLSDLISKFLDFPTS